MGKGTLRWKDAKHCQIGCKKYIEMRIEEQNYATGEMRERERETEREREKRERSYNDVTEHVTTLSSSQHGPR